MVPYWSQNLTTQGAHRRTRQTELWYNTREKLNPYINSEEAGVEEGGGGGYVSWRYEGVYSMWHGQNVLTHSTPIVTTGYATPTLCQLHTSDILLCHTPVIPWFMPHPPSHDLCHSHIVSCTPVTHSQATHLSTPENKPHSENPALATCPAWNWELMPKDHPQPTLLLPSCSTPKDNNHLNPTSVVWTYLTHWCRSGCIASRVHFHSEAGSYSRCCGRCSPRGSSLSNRIQYILTSHHWSPGGERSGKRKC